MMVEENSKKCYSKGNSHSASPKKGVYTMMEVYIAVVPARGECCSGIPTKYALSMT